MPRTSEEIIGREAELAAIDALLSIERSGLATILLDGEAGIGKTTLWSQGLKLAVERGHRVLEARPAQGETALAYAALTDLFEPDAEAVLPGVAAPRRHALSVALLHDAPAAPVDDRDISAGALDVVRALTEGGPVLIAIDDVQWIDAPTERVLRFALRRLADAPVSVLLTRRTDGGPGTAPAAPLGLDRVYAPLTVLDVGPLSLGALHRMLSTRTGVAVSRPTLRRLHELSGGNPYFALEIVRAVERAGTELRADRLVVPGSLRELVRHRVEALPPRPLRAVQVISALSQPTLELLRRLVRTATADLAALEAADVVTVTQGRIRFTHPLLRSTVYESIPDPERLALHRRLAESVSDPEERARHLALGAEGPDEAVAAALDDAAERANERGAPEAAGELAELAANLTPASHPELRSRRAVRAALLHYLVGGTGRARRTLEGLLPGQSGAPTDLEALIHLALVAGELQGVTTGVELYERVLQAAEPGSPAEAAARAAMAYEMAFTGELRRGLDHGRRAVDLLDRAGAEADLPTRAFAVGSLALVEALLGLPRAGRTLARAMEVDVPAGDLPLDRRPPAIRARILIWSGRLQEARTELADLAEAARRRHEDIDLSAVLFLSSLVESSAGAFHEADRLALEGLEIAQQTGVNRLENVSAHGLAATALGDMAAAQAATAEVANEPGVGLHSLMRGAWIAGFVAVSTRDLPAVVDHLLPLHERLEALGFAEPGIYRFVPDLVEALTGVGRAREAATITDGYEARARKLRHPSALAGALRGRGLVLLAEGDPPAAIQVLGEALEAHDRAEPMPFERARTQLILGAALRRAKRRREGRDAALAARAEFERLGTPLWTARADEELARMGQQRTESAAELTPTEIRVADLVATGRANPEVAALLSMSRKTVEANLSRIYSKLGVRSRTELARMWRPEA